MRRVAAAAAGLLVLGLAAGWGLSGPQLQPAGLEPVPAGTPDVANGELMFNAGGCESCHATPDQPDGTRLGGGLALPSQFGTFYVPNISSHSRDGIGSWTSEQFLRALRGGVAPDGQHYYPAFPYTSYQRMTAADVRDLFGFMKTLPAVEGKVRDHDLPFPFKVRRGLGLWKLAFLDGRAFTPDPAKSPSWNRGAYLVEGAGHCAECHSPRNAVGAIAAERRFAGGPNPEGKGWVPNITPHENGLNDWSKSDIVEVLTSGLTPSGDSVGSNMAGVVRHMAKLPDSDRAAIAEYLLSLPPRPGRKGPS